MSRIEVIHGIFTLSVRVEVMGYGEWWVIAVYGPTRVLGRDSFWEELHGLVGLRSRWFIGGDFNVILHSCEKLWGLGSPRV